MCTSTLLVLFESGSGPQEGKNSGFEASTDTIRIGTKLLAPLGRKTTVADLV